MLTLSAQVARRLFVTRQLLSGTRPPPDRDAILGVVKQLGCLQLDPISAVAKSPELVLCSRLGPYDRADLAALLWQERRLFEYWAHAASIVPTDDFAIHAAMMREYRSPGRWGKRTRRFLRDNAALRLRILARLAREGPLPGRAFEDVSKRSGRATGWTSGRNVSRMLQALFVAGHITVAGRDGNGRMWDLAGRHHPAPPPLGAPRRRDLVTQAVERSLRALGVATATQISRHFTRGRYPDLPGVVAGLVRSSRIVPVAIRENGEDWPGSWMVHAQDASLVERIGAGGFEPRTTLLSPFDNLICDRERTERMFGFRFRIEIYVPKAKRQHGYYVMPILHGDTLVGRVDPAFDRESSTLRLHAIHAEPGAPASATPALAAAIEELATFLGTTRIAYPRSIPAQWRGALH